MIGKNVFGVDFGTSAVKIYSLRKNRILIEHDMIAIKDGEQVIAVGDDAFEMYEKNPPGIEVARPMLNGRIADVAEVEMLLRLLLRKTDRHAGSRPYIIFSAPLNMSEIEKRAYYAISSIGSLKNPRIAFVDRPISDALGLGINLSKTRGSMIINLGASCTEISVISGEQVIVSDQIPIGGQQLNEAIMNEVRRSANLLIGQKTARRLKAVLATFEVITKAEGREVSGIDTLSGLPRTEVITSELVSTAVEAELHKAAEMTRTFLERMPPQIAKCVTEEGIYLSGGTARIPGIDRYFSRIIGCRINISPDYEFTTVKGLKEVIQHKELRKWTWSIKEKR